MNTKCNVYKGQMNTFLLYMLTYVSVKYLPDKQKKQKPIVIDNIYTLIVILKYTSEPKVGMLVQQFRAAIYSVI